MACHPFQSVGIEFKRALLQSVNLFYVQQCERELSELAKQDVP